MPARWAARRFDQFAESHRWGALLVLVLVFGSLAVVAGLGTSLLNRTDDKAQRARIDARQAKALTAAIIRVRNFNRRENCHALHSLFSGQRDQIVADDRKFQSGAYDKLFPSFASPEVKRLSHQSAVRRAARYGNARLPSYCPQRRRSSKRPGPAKRPHFHFRLRP